ncbi:Flp pilus assembly protein CpaB [Enterovibrio norvegicus FF-33]|uniref:Flp pilus assembly protein CpaB n=1 Tax=Enterovibrio norvegicus FF-454 TaxID=1185651 RepID=A0A1E5C5N4_9GAMM|nr:Flp pilus assembly protein CpaB [Enterovibrio norvegicus]OEE60841.1 Flp pilus assembly protein CpaB [Enterovibrio norvegicus FF-454]OEE67388.1 Flp pilus assembly protein CpaB [Enterovibrio norvegicus FF-33]OEE74544.1 Flp pilus assembly protein CpaB [Enterovibrio norvegicus FF-162]
MSQRVFFLIALLSIGVGVLGLSGFFQSKHTTASGISNISYQVAQLKSSVKRGDTLTRENIRYFKLREEDALKNGIVSDIIISHVPGMVAKRDIGDAVYLSSSDFLLPNDPNYLDAVIKDGMSPYALTIDRKEFIGSGISVGDKVDVMILTSDEQNIGETSRSTYIESFRSLSVSPLLRNIRVLAIEDDHDELLPLTIELNREQIAKMVIARRIGIVEIIKASGNELYSSGSMNADTHDVLPNFKSVTEIRGQNKAFN